MSSYSFEGSAQWPSRLRQHAAAGQNLKIRTPRPRALTKPIGRIRNFWVNALFEPYRLGCPVPFQDLAILVQKLLTEESLPEMSSPIPLLAAVSLDQQMR